MPTTTPTLDKEALRRRYAEERDKRIRPDGNDQYVEIAGQLGHYVDDPYVPSGQSRQSAALLPPRPPVLPRQCRCGEASPDCCCNPPRHCPHRCPCRSAAGLSAQTTRGRRASGRILSRRRAEAHGAAVKQSWPIVAGESARAHGPSMSLTIHRATLRSTPPQYSPAAHTTGS